jgi:hypothetical protein
MTTPTNAQYQVALDYASRDFNEDDPVRRAFVNVVNYLYANRSHELRRLTFGILRKAAGLEPDDGEILHRTIGYLTGARANLLCVGYEYISEDYEHELDTDEVDLFLTEAEFCDPRTGLLVPNSASCVYVFFRPNYAAFH